MVKPYTDVALCENSWIRIFDINNAKEQDFVWHRDSRDRKIKVIYGANWYFQYDDSMPINITEGDVLYVEAMEYHRLIMGDTTLALYIQEL